jgi:hypothetical protein
VPPLEFLQNSDIGSIGTHVFESKRRNDGHEIDRLPAGGSCDVSGIVLSLRAAVGRTSGVVARGIMRMAQRWGGVAKPTPAQLTTLRHLLSDLAPFLNRIDGIPYQTDDPVLNAAAERVHDALRGLLAEIAVMIYEKR